MVQRVLEQARGCGLLTDVVVATDDQRIVDHVVGLRGRAVLTSAHHPSGTDRCHEAVGKVGSFDVVVNIQGDEPFIEPAQLNELCNALISSQCGIATLAQIVTDDRDLDDPGEVLITTDKRMNALYFSRCAIPFLRDAEERPRHTRFRYLKHVGLYGYRADVLEQLVGLKPSALELAEGLEQLRWLENGFQVHVALTSHPSFCVDTPADLAEARRRAAAL